MKRLVCFGVLLAASFIMLEQPASALYKWVDEKGVYHFSETPDPSGRSKQVDENAEPGEELDTPAEEPAPPKIVPQKEQPKATVKPAPAPQPAPVDKARVQVSAPTKTVSAGTGTAAVTGTSVTSAVVTTASLSASASSGTAVTSTATSSLSGTVVSSVSTTATPSTLATVTAAAPQTRTIYSRQPNALVSTFLAAFMTAILIAAVVFYIYFSLCLYLIARKLNVPAAWTAWVPILSVWPFVGSAGKSLWWVLLFVIPIVNLIVITYLWMCIVENLGRNKWLGLLMLVPVANLVYPGVLAFSSEK